MINARMKPRDENKARDILAATLVEVEALGLAGLSIAAVARRANVATGTVYIYFESKEALIDALYLATKKEMAETIFRAGEPGPVEELPVRVAFERMCLAYLEYLVENGAAVVFMGQVKNSPYLSETSKRETSTVTKALTDLLARGRRERLLKDLDDELVLAFLQGTLREMATLAAREPRANRKKRLRQIAALCWDALKA